MTKSAIPLGSVLADVARQEQLLKDKTDEARRQAQRFLAESRQAAQTAFDQGMAAVDEEIRVMEEAAAARRMEKREAVLQSSREVIEKIQTQADRRVTELVSDILARILPGAGEQP